MRKKRSRVWVVLVIVACAGAGGYWYADSKGWFEDRGPSNPPTAAERARMEEIERSSASASPQAKAGVGVVPKGSTPPPSPEPVASTTASGTPPVEPTSDAMTTDTATSSVSE